MAFQVVDVQAHNLQARMGGLRTGGGQFFLDSNARLWRWGFPVLDVDGLASLQYFPSQEHSKRKAWQEVVDGVQQLSMTPMYPP